MANTPNVKQGKENEITIKQDTEDGLLQVLLKEYELTMTRLEGLNNRTFQVLTVAITVLGFLAYYAQQQNLPISAAWLIPLFGLLMYTLLLFFSYSVLASFWNAKLLSRRINKLLPETALIHFGENSPESTFFSTRRGNPKLRWMRTILIGCSILLFPPIIYLSLNNIYNRQSHLAGSLFLLFYASLAALLLYAASGLGDLVSFYRNFSKKFNATEPIPEVLQSSKNTSATSAKSAAFTFIIPRSWDVIAKGPFFIYGIVTALICVGISEHPMAGLPYSRLGLINFLFSISTDWKHISDVPIWAVLVLVAIYFAVEEILLQQAKLLWDDIRDVQRDKILVLNNRRALATGAMSISSAIQQMVVRWVLALILGYVLGGIDLLTIYLLISFHQMVYVLWAKPRSAKHPTSRRQQRELLFVLSFNVSLRFLAGVVSVVGFQWSLSPFVLFFVLFYFCSFGAIAAFWKMEAEHYVIMNQIKALRSQSDYYLSHGQFWQHVGLVAAVLFGSFMVIIQTLTISCSIQLLPLQVLYGQCTSDHKAITYAAPPGLLSVFLILGLIATFTLITMLLVHLIGKLGNLLIRSIEKIKGVITVILFLLTITLLLKASLDIFPVLGWNRVYVLFWSFLLLNTGYLLMYEGMTYRNYTNTDIWKSLLHLKDALYRFFFGPI